MVFFLLRLFLVFLVADGLRVDDHSIPPVVHIAVPSHLIFNLFDDQLGLLVNIGTEVLVIHLELKGIGQHKFLR